MNTAGKEEGVKDAIDRLSAGITTAGGKVETVQKMDKRNFSRVADKKHSSGFYVNVIFESTPAVIHQMQSQFALNEDVFRVLFTEAGAPVTETQPAN